MANEGQKNTGSGSGGTGLAPNIASLLCYICAPVTSIIFIVLEKQNLDVKFHAWQGTFLGCAWIAVYVFINIMASLMGYFVYYFLWPINLGLFILWVICVIKAYQGERWKIPVVGDLAAKQAGA